MEKIDTYIINLPKDYKRKEYINKTLNKFKSFIEIIFIDAVYGKELSQSELDSVFDNKSTINKYGRKLEPNEIGCTLSHRCVFARIVKSSKKYAIIFEDDIELLDNFETILKKVYSLMEVETPRILLLSGGYTYYKKFKYNNADITRVHNGYYTHSYMINKSAAKLLLNLPPNYIADDWKYLKDSGIELLGIKPHLVDQLRDGTFESNIWNESHRINKKLIDKEELFKFYKQRIISKLLETIKFKE